MKVTLLVLALVGIGQAEDRWTIPARLDGAQVMRRIAEYAPRLADAMRGPVQASTTAGEWVAVRPTTWTQTMYLLGGPNSTVWIHRLRAFTSTEKAALRAMTTTYPEPMTP